MKALALIDRLLARGLPEPGIRHYFSGLLVFLAALAMRFAFWPPVAPPFITFFPATILSTLVGGVRAGLMTAALGALAAWYFFMEPRWSFGLLAPDDMLSLAFYLAIETMICTVIHRLQLGNANAARLVARLNEREQRLQGVLREAQEARLNAEKASREKSLFLAATSHDLRQPLQALTLYYGVLAGRQPSRDLPMVNMGKSLAILSAMLNDLLELSQLQSGEVQVKSGVFTGDELMQNAVETFRPQAEGKGVELRCVPCRLPVSTDAVIFRRIALNLISNAVRYTSSGRVLVGFRRRGDMAELQVWDTGIGIPADRFEAIFDEFMQLANPERSNEKGTGLGLAIARHSAALLGGRIMLSSTVGRGSVFRFAQPIAASPRGLAQAIAS